MNPRRVVTAMIVAFLVIGVLVAYSLQTLPAPITSTITVTVSGGLTTKTVLGQVKVISATGSQAVLCTATSYQVPDTMTSTSTSDYNITTSTLVIGNSTTIVVGEPNSLQTYIASSVYASATNSTNTAGYVVTTTSTGYAGMASEWRVMTCTYLP